MGDFRGGELVYYAFDLLYLDGRDLRDRPLLERKRLLKTVLKRAGDRVIYSKHFRDGPALLAEMCRRGGGCRDWVKIKCTTWRDEHNRATAGWATR